MKVYLSADIEGIAGIANWDEASRSKPDYPPFAMEMRKEVQAACEGAVCAGADEIWIKDAHGVGRNLNFEGLPPCAKIIRAFSGHPFCMMQELDDTFDAAMMIGYHSPAGSDGNPLAHTLDDEHVDYIKINDVLASEFLIGAYIASYVGVPVVFVSGDEGLCDHVRGINAHISTVAVKRGMGSSVISPHPEVAAGWIKEGAEKALTGNYKKCLVALPERFSVEMSFFHHFQAYKKSFYPGVKRTAGNKLTFETDDYFEVLRMLSFVID